MTKNFKGGRSDEEKKPRVKKRAQKQDVSNAVKVNHERGGSSKICKPTYSNCGMNNFLKGVAVTKGCFLCGKNDHNDRDCANIATWGSVVKQDPSIIPFVDEQTKNLLYALKSINEANSDEALLFYSSLRVRIS